MSDRIEPRKPAVKAVRTAAKSFSRQALELDRIFTCAVVGSAPGMPDFHQDMRVALKAQAQYRATLKILLDLEKERNADLSGEPRTAIRGKTEKREIRASELLKAEIVKAEIVQNDQVFGEG